MLFRTFAVHIKLALKMKAGYLVLTFITITLHSLVVWAEPNELFGVWVVDNDLPQWKTTIVVEPNRISLGSPKCQNLSYSLLKHVSLGTKGEVYALDIAAPPDACRYYKQEKVIWHFRVNHSEQYTYLHLDICPTLEDLDLIMQGKNRNCSGTYFAKKKAKLPNAR